MFHLWRKRQSLALFPSQILLDNGSHRIVLQQDPSDNEALFAVVTDVMAEARRTNRRNIRLSLVVSDRFAAIVPLPWQAALSRTAEIDAYSHVQFERSGQSLNDNWLMFSYFRHFGASGLAYALPTDFLARLRELGLSHDIVIKSVLPFSALVYSQLKRSKHGNTVHVLRESCRVTAFVSDRKGLMTYATEPSTEAGEQAVERLLRRLQAECELHVVEFFTPEPGIKQDPSALISRVLPSARFTILDANFWKR